MAIGAQFGFRAAERVLVHFPLAVVGDEQVGEAVVIIVHPGGRDGPHLLANLTLNYGLRWEFTGVMTNTNNTFMAPTVEDLVQPSAAPFQPGVFASNSH